MQRDDGSPASKLGMSGLLHTLARLVEEASILNMPLTGNAIRQALLLCQQEQAPECTGSNSTETAERFGLIH